MCVESGEGGKLRVGPFDLISLLGWDEGRPRAHIHGNSNGTVRGCWWFIGTTRTPSLGNITVQGVAAPTYVDDVRSYQYVG